MCDASTGATSYNRMTLGNNSGQDAAIDKVDVTFGVQLRLLLLKNFYLRKRQLVSVYAWNDKETVHQIPHSCRSPPSYCRRWCCSLFCTRYARGPICPGTIHVVTMTCALCRRQVCCHFSKQHSARRRPNASRVGRGRSRAFCAPTTTHCMSSRRHDLTKNPLHVD